MKEYVNKIWGTKVIVTFAFPAAVDASVLLKNVVTGGEYWVEQGWFEYNYMEA